MYSIHAYYKSGAYYKLKMYNEMLLESNEALRINKSGVDALSIKGVSLDNLSKYQEAIVEYDKALKMRSK